MTDPGSERIPEAVWDAAAVWLQRRDRGLDEATDASFQQWRKADPAHRIAYDRLEEDWCVGAGLANTPIGRQRMLVPAPFHLRRSTHLGAVAAVSVVAIGLVTTLLPQNWWRPSIVAQAEAQTYQTAIGEQRTVALTDGSHLTLDTDTKVTVDVSPTFRSATLAKGRARFAIAPSKAGPFVVHLRTGTITADTATFDAAIADRGLHDRVRTLEGKVIIRGNLAGAPGGPVSLAPADHKGTALSTPTVSDNDPLNTDGNPAGMIALDATPIGTAVNEINRYNRTQVRVDAADVAGHTISGAFRIWDPAGFAAAVAALHGLRVSRPRPDLIVLNDRH